MELRAGLYIKTKDGKRFGKNYQDPIMRIKNLRKTSSNRYLLNDNTSVDIDNIEVISGEEYVAIFKQLHPTMPEPKIKQIPPLPKKQVNNTSTKAPRRKAAEFGYAKGDYIRKKNWQPFGQRPVLKIDSIGVVVGKKNEIRFAINGNKHFFSQEDIIKLTEEEAQAIIAEYESLTLSETLKQDIKTSCFREDNGEPKIKYTDFNAAKYALFMLRKRSPEKNLQAYTCPHCNHIHIGKPPKEEPVEKLIPGKIFFNIFCGLFLSGLLSFFIYCYSSRSIDGWPLFWTWIVFFALFTGLTFVPLKKIKNGK